LELNCKGIVINSHDLKEKDKVIVIYTDIAGKIALAAKGVKTFKSHDREAIMLFSKTSFILREGKSLYSIKSADLEKHFTVNSYESYDLACKFAGIIYRLVPDDYINIKLFIMLSNFLTFIEINSITETDFIYSSFILKFLYLLGHYPCFGTCICKNEKSDEYLINIQESQLYCTNCIGECCEGGTFRVSSQVTKDIDFVLRWDYDIKKIIYGDRANKVLAVVNEYLKWHFHYKVN